MCEAITGIKCVMCPEASADCVTNHRFHTDNTVAVDTCGGPLWKAERSIATLCYKSTWADLKTTQNALLLQGQYPVWIWAHTHAAWVTRNKNGTNHHVVKLTKIATWCPLKTSILYVTLHSTVEGNLVFQDSKLQLMRV